MSTSSSMSAVPECPVCAGTGWKAVEVPGKSSRVTRCDCRIDSRAERLLKLASIPARYENCTLASFVPDFSGPNPSLTNARWAVERFVEDYPFEKLGMLLVGPVGVGKTHLAVGAIRQLICTKGLACLFCDYRELLKEIQNSYNPSVQATELEILRPVFEAEVLVLDELGAVKPTEWVWDTVSYILNSRYNEKKTTIITTNFPDLPAHKAQEDEGQGNVENQNAEPQSGTTGKKRNREITLGDRITDRMRSRLHEMCRLITLKGVDFRTLGTSHRR